MRGRREWLASISVGSRTESLPKPTAERPWKGGVPYPVGLVAVNLPVTAERGRMA